MAKNVIYVPSCHSTNLLAEQLLAEGDIYEGTVVVTDEQTAGRGRMDKAWESNMGENIMLTLILKPSFIELESQFFLNIFSSLAVSSTVASLSLSQPKIKWPNDVMVDGKKISGILVKNLLKGKKIASAMVGIGLNVNQKEFTNPNAVSLKNISGRNFNLEEVFNTLISNLEKYYLRLRDSSKEQLTEEYHQSLFGKDQELLFESDERFRGVIKGVDRKGHLIIEKEGVNAHFNLDEIKYIFQAV